MIPKLTIGMAHYEDFDGVYFTIQNLRLNHNACLPDVEFIVIDNSPNTLSGKAVEHFCKSVGGIRYIPYPDVVGTASTRNRIFAEASAPVVVCMDCHVMPRWPDFCKNVIDYFESGTDGLIQGPLFYDNLLTCYTHFNPVWSSQMFGVWGSARRLEDGRVVSTSNVGGQMQVHFLRGDHKSPMDIQTIPNLPMVGLSPDDEDIEIPCQGLGMFMSRKETWLGFNKDFKGFGGEEGYIHLKYQRAGRKCLSVSKFGWVHRFGRPLGVKYPLDLRDRVRNYVLGHLENGQPLDQIKKHFVTSGKFPEEQWVKLLSNPVGYNWDGKVNDKASFDNLESLYRWPGHKDRPHTFLMPHLEKLANDPGQVIIEVSDSRETSIALLYGLHRTSRLISCVHDIHYLIDEARKNKTGKDFKIHPLGSPSYQTDSVSSLPETECDSFVISTANNGEDLVKYLDGLKAVVRRRFVVLNSRAYGPIGLNQKPGFSNAVNQWLKDNPEWFVASHTQDGLGMTVISRWEEDRPADKVNAWSPGYGVGTSLKSLLGKLGITATANCSCNYRASEMDRLGLKWCRENQETILEWLKEESTKRKLPFSKVAASGVLFLAIRLGERQIRKYEMTSLPEAGRKKP